MPSFQAHTVRFFIPEPKAIHCAALHNKTKKLAVSRSDNSVELWDVSCALGQRGAAVCQVRLAAAAGASVESLCWCAGRLFSTGLHGHVLEHAWRAGLRSTASTAAIAGAAAWCLAAEPCQAEEQEHERMAVGTEDGQVVLFTVSEEGLVFQKRLTKQERRILCVAWHPSGRHLAAGSVNTVCVHDTATGGLLSRISVGRQQNGRDTLVWSVAVLQDLTVVTGDSRGRVSFWDGRLGALRTAHTSHQADVLAVAVAAGGTAVLAAGVDPTVVRFERLSGGWVRSARVHLHERDVRVLITDGVWLISAGVDATLVFDIVGNNKHTARSSPLPQLGTVLPTPALPGLATASDSGLHLWRLPSPADEQPQRPQQLLQLQCRRGEPLVCAAVSPDASWLAYCTPERLRLHRLETCPGRPSLRRVRSLPPAAAAAAPARHLAFSPIGDVLLVVSAAGRLLRLRLADSDDALTEEDLGTADGRQHGDDGDDDDDECDGDEALDLLTVSDDGRRAALADRSGGLVVWDLAAGQAVSARPPRHTCPVTALVFRPADCGMSGLVAAYADRSVAEYEPETGRHTAWSRWAAAEDRLPVDWRRRALPVRHAVFAGGRLLLHDDSAVCSLDAAGGGSGGGGKRARAASGRRVAQSAGDAALEPVVIMDKYRHLLYLGSLGGDRLLAVEAPAARVEEKLPPALRRKRFGVA